MAHRLTVNLKSKHAMQVTRVSIGRLKLVYVLVAQRPLRYPWGRSKIAYIGTTRKGMTRIAQSVAARSDDVLGLHGVREFHVRIVTCPPRPNVQTWCKLERALLLTFRQRYGSLPKCNTLGHKMKERDDFKYFNRRRLDGLIESLA